MRLLQSMKLKKKKKLWLKIEIHESEEFMCLYFKQNLQNFMH